MQYLQIVAADDEEAEGDLCGALGGKHALLAVVQNEVCELVEPLERPLCDRQRGWWVCSGMRGCALQRVQ